MLGEIGPPASAMLPAMIEELNDSDPEVRQAAADAVAKVGDRSE
jgi:HEAT repeat protein